MTKKEENKTCLLNAAIVGTAGLLGLEYVVLFTEYVTGNESFFLIYGYPLIFYPVIFWTTKFFIKNKIKNWFLALFIGGLYTLSATILIMLPLFYYYGNSEQGSDVLVFASIFALPISFGAGASSGFVIAEF